MRTQVKFYASVLLTSLFTLQLGIVGIMQITGAEPIASNVRDLGYPNWARVAVGLLQLAAVMLLWIPHYRLSASLLLIFVLVVATASHMRVSDTMEKTLPAIITLVFLIVLAALNYSRRLHPL